MSKMKDEVERVVGKLVLCKKRRKTIERLEERMFEAWRSYYDGVMIGTALRIHGGCAYEADKKKIMKKKKWDKECDNFIRKMKREIRKYS